MQKHPHPSFTSEAKRIAKVEAKGQQLIVYALDLHDLVNLATYQGIILGSPGYISPELTEWYNPQIASYLHDLGKAQPAFRTVGLSRPRWRYHQGNTG